MEANLPVDVWGPRPSPEEVEEAYQHGDQLHIKYLMDALHGSMSSDHLAHILGVETSEVRRMIKDKEIVAIQVDEVRAFIPSWQFEENEDGALKVNDQVKELWALWGEDWWDVVGFCHMMSAREIGGSGKRGYEIAHNPDGNSGWWGELKHRVKNHGIEQL